MLVYQQGNDDQSEDRGGAFPEQVRIAFDQRGGGGVEIVRIGMAEVMGEFGEALDRKSVV